MQLLGAEAPGPATEKLTPRIAQTAKALWGIYVLFTALETIVLIGLGLTPFEALNHAFTTMATGGFSTNGESIGAYGGAVQVVVTAFMWLAGINFVLHFNLLRGRPLKMLRDAEFRFYVGLAAIATLLVSVDLLLNDVAGPLEALRLGAFQVASIGTGTGYTTADYDAWPHLARALLFILMFVGGCAGSTTGSLKVARVMIVVKQLGVELKRYLQPHGVFPVRMGRRAIPDEVASQVINYLMLFLTLFIAGGLVISATGLDLVTAFSASATSLANVGPGFAEIGPTRTMDHLPVVAKLVMIGLMITGRLELYTVLLALYVLRRLII
jgi:trk system potassium uptake protein TrkH